MKTLSGIEKKGRLKLSDVLRKAKGTVTVEEASAILGLDRVETAKLMARWAEQGWLTRLRRGLYAPVPLEARTVDTPIEDLWVVAERIFKPCYIGGWSAAEYWGLTEQIFRTILVFTTRKFDNRRPKIQGTEFWVKKIGTSRFFGMKTVWRGQVRVQVSDPTKTIVDLLDDPSIVGGARMMENILKSYLASKEKDIKRLLDYADRLKNGAVFKRLGFLLERSGFQDSVVLEAFRNRLTRGNAKLDPKLPNDRLITRWRLWVPSNWVENKRD
jgi:predicted transcriptional regulator of viral defense system